jgi:hypothetical protein
MINWERSRKYVIWSLRLSLMFPRGGERYPNQWNLQYSEAR